MNLLGPEGSTRFRSHATTKNPNTQVALQAQPACGFALADSSEILVYAYTRCSRQWQMHLQMLGPSSTTRLVSTVCVLPSLMCPDLVLPFAEMNILYFPLLVLKRIDFTTGHISRGLKQMEVYLSLEPNPVFEKGQVFLS